MKVDHAVRAQLPNPLYIAFVFRTALKPVSVGRFGQEKVNEFDFLQKLVKKTVNDLHDAAIRVRLFDRSQGSQRGKNIAELAKSNRNEC